MSIKNKKLKDKIKSDTQLSFLNDDQELNQLDGYTLGDNFNWKRYKKQNQQKEKKHAKKNDKE